MNTLKRVFEGYEAFGFDSRLLDETIEFSSPKVVTKPKAVLEEEPLSVKDQIIKVLRESGRGMKSGKIADLLGVSKKET